MDFNPLNYPRIWRVPEYISSDSGWVEHIPFAFLMVELLRPGRIVELGAFRGDSYCAFCQSVKELNQATQCVAIDTWEGDIHLGKLGPEILTNLKQYHDPRYGAFSKLIQSTFDAARDSFEDGSIDLLHIDGMHTYEAVKHDFETWRAKISERGVVLFHDTTERKENFGVWKFWEEISAGYLSFNFLHGHGLGVLAVGKDVPADVTGFLKFAGEHAEAVRGFFAEAGRKVDYFRTAGTLLQLLHGQQMIVNEWKQLTGQAIDRSFQTLSQAMHAPIRFAYQLSEEIGRLASDDLQLRQMIGKMRQEKGGGA